MFTPYLNSLKKTSGVKRGNFFNFFRRGVFFRYVIFFVVFVFIFQLGYIYVGKYYFPFTTLIQLSIKGKYGELYRKKYVSYDRMSPYIKVAVIAAEDANFGDHNGFSWDGIERAMNYNKNHPNRIKGASTISQQTAKNVFLWNGRTWLRKGLEVYFTTMIEWLWGKKRILEVYLNVIEMGPGIIGVEAASMYYYNKHANALTISEAAMLASCLPNPKFLNPHHPTVLLQRKHRRVINSMLYLLEDENVKALLKN